jgi:HEPN domain-containing protein
MKITHINNHLTLIRRTVLKLAIKEKLKDADSLILAKRYSTAFYIAGYALEMALKLKICKLLNFEQGFPESKLDISVYQKRLQPQQALFQELPKIKDIKNHDLTKLLFYSGAEYKIRSKFMNEWDLIVNWNPEMRYKIDKFLKRDVVDKVNAIKTLIAQL